ncbi:hypothetical protein [uncultured Endozoicomonas sp.]|uniref:hypothetical protein n=1 Tax=uncultured Endozoicomonas sp. TaxID=432652 RepID=UPI002601DE6D|nr:hypothetical protein [uncultured Endozoicomonas sp.]
MSSLAINPTSALTYGNPTNQKINSGAFKDRKVSIIDSIKLFFKKIWTEIKKFFISLYDRCINKSSVAQPILENKSSNANASYQNIKNPEKNQPLDISRQHIEQLTTTQSTDISRQKAMECFNNNRATFRMLAGFNTDPIEGVYKDTEPMKHELDQLRYQRNQAASATYAPKGVPFHHFYLGRTIGLLIDTGNGKIVKEASVGDCGTVPCDRDGHSLGWSIERHQYERTVGGDQNSDKIKREFNHYKLINPNIGIDINGQTKFSPMQKDFSDFKKIIHESQQTNPNGKQYINEAVLDYGLNDVVGIVQVNQPDSQKQLEPKDKALALEFQKQIKNKLGKDLPILFYNKDMGNIIP